MVNWIGLVGLVLALSSTAQSPQQLQQVPQQPRQISCPAQKMPLPEYPSDLVAIGIYGVMDSNGLPVLTQYRLQYEFYNSKEAPLGLDFISREGLSDFLENGEFNVVKISEIGISNGYSAIIYRGGGVTYVTFGTAKDHFGGFLEKTFCYNSWSPNLVREAEKTILEKRNSLPKPQKMPQINAT